MNTSKEGILVAEPDVRLSARRSSEQLQIGDKPLVALDAVLAALGLRLLEHHQNRRIRGLEDPQISADALQLRQLFLDRHRRQPFGDVDQLDQALDRDPGRLDLALQRLGGGGFRLPFGVQCAGPLVGLAAVFCVMRLDPLQEDGRGQLAGIDPAFCLGPGRGEPIPDPRVAGSR